MKPVEIDAFEFCRKKDVAHGEVPVAGLPRLVLETMDDSGSIAWSVQGVPDLRGYPAMTLRITGEVRLQCQRCLAAMPYRIDSDATLVVAADEASADVLDEQLTDDPVEVIVGTQALNLLLLVEDEALLALPPAPRHENCDAQAGLAVQAPAVKKESPFAVLAKLKR